MKTTPKSAEKSTAKATPKKKEPTIYKRLSQDDGPAPVDVSFEGVATEAKVAKSGGFVHHLKLEAPSAFKLLKTVCHLPKF